MESDIASVTTPSPDNDATRTASWREHINAWRETGQTQRAYTRQHELSIARFTYWKNKFYPPTHVLTDRVLFRKSLRAKKGHLTHLLPAS